jgi:hypothetical protein
MAGQDAEITFHPGQVDLIDLIREKQLCRRDKVKSKRVQGLPPRSAGSWPSYHPLTIIS